MLYQLNQHLGIYFIKLIPFRQFLAASGLLPVIPAQVFYNQLHRGNRSSDHKE